MVVGRVKNQEPCAGLELYEPKGNTPTIREVLLQYMARNPNWEVVAIFKPNISLHPNPYLLLDFMASAGTGRAWSFYVMGPNGTIPELFATTTTVIPHLIKSIPADLTFEGDDWAVWVDDWMRVNMPAHRYVDAAKFNLIGARVQLPPEPAQIFSVAALAKEALADIAPYSDWARQDESIKDLELPAEAVSEPVVPVSDQEQANAPVKPKKPVKAKGKGKRGRPKKVVETPVAS